MFGRLRRDRAVVPRGPQFDREFFNGIERGMTEGGNDNPPANNLVPMGAPRRKLGVVEKADLFDRMEREYATTLRRLFELAQNKEMLRAEIMADLVADKTKTESRLEEITRLTEHFSQRIEPLATAANGDGGAEHQDEQPQDDVQQEK